MDASWLGWVKTNLERNCAPVEIRQILLDNGFSPGEIRAAMGASYPEDDLGVDYEGLSKIRITSPESDAVRVDSDKIQLYTLESFLNDTQCDELVAMVNQNLRPSTVTLESKDKYFRTSSTCYLTESGAPTVEAVDKKIASTLGINITYSEPIQGQKYLPGQQFKAHTDFFEPRTEEYQKHCRHTGNRTWTFMIYLTDVENGGGTAFPEIGRTFHPKKGMALAWNNLGRDGVPNRFTLHCGEPVVAGEKIIITKWFREKGAGKMF